MRIPRFILTFIQSGKMWYRQRTLTKALGALPEQAIRARIVVMLEQLNVNDFHHYRYIHGVGRTVLSIYVDINDLTKAIQQHIQQIKTETILSNHYHNQPVPRNLDKYISVSNGVIVNPVASLAEFKAKTLALCGLLEASDHVDVGVPEHNLRMATKLLREIYSLSQHLVDISIKRTLLS